MARFHPIPQTANAGFRHAKGQGNQNGVDVMDNRHYTYFKDLHKDQECIIIANGPSLKKVPIEFLESRPSFGCNRIHVLWEKKGFAPTYYVSLGLNHLWEKSQRDRVIPFLASVKAAFLNRMTIHEFPQPNVYSILSNQWVKSQEEKESYSNSPLEWIGIGRTMIYGLLQIADYMGFSTALVVGLDHEYPPPENPKKHFYRDEEVAEWEMAPHLPREVWYGEANKVLDNAYRIWHDDKGKKIYNLTPGSKYIMFPKDKLENWHE
jgi:hypothetical protein